jgi:Na+/H+ antiporter NhaD/arsenite permease-like protein
MTDAGASYWQDLGFGANLLNLAPFIGLLVAIAVLPLLPRTSSWWESHRHKAWVASVFALLGLGAYVIPTGDWGRAGQTYLDYMAFLALLTSLYIISGGIHIGGSFVGFPRTNTFVLMLGALLANLFGTTGASMLLIRPLLHANRKRVHKSHIVVFFIFIVSNCGGLLTPLGDPPLYLGFLRGVSFDWTFHLWKEWAFTIIFLLAVFHLLDVRFFKMENSGMKGALEEDLAFSGRRLHLQGKWNLLLLAGVMGCVVGSGYWLQPFLKARVDPSSVETGTKLFQIFVLTVLAWVSWKNTPKHIHALNRFTFGPIREVALLFFGVFGAMLPALVILAAKGPTFPLSRPWHYFWASGLLSGFLDSAPAYLAFGITASSHLGYPSGHMGVLAEQAASYLAAISCGSVFMGALTYIGNGPNFMVKAIAEHAKVKMPSFGGYILWSGAVLIPLFVVETFLFF